MLFILDIKQAFVIEIGRSGRGNTLIRLPFIGEIEFGPEMVRLDETEGWSIVVRSWPDRRSLE